jgi:hypothetical protein
LKRFLWRDAQFFVLQQDVGKRTKGRRGAEVSPLLKEWQREGWPRWRWPSSAPEGTIKATRQKQDFRLPAAIDAIATGNVQLD